MSAIAERIAKLPPEKRALFFKELKQQQDCAPIPAQLAKPIQPVATNRHRVVHGSAENFRAVVAKTGILDSITFRSIPRRVPGPNQIEIQTKAIGVNFRDLMIALGMYPSLPGQIPVMGSDCSGVVVSVGENVDRFKVGDEVYAFGAPYEAYTIVHASFASKKSPSMTFEEAAAIPTVFVTAYFALTRLARLAPGERVLIHSAAGGVGLAAIQVAKHCRAEIYATVGNEEKRELLRGLGVQNLMDSHSISWADEVMRLTGDGVDVILNSLTGEAIPRGLDVLRSLGRFVEIGKRDIYSNAQIGLFPFHKGISFQSIDLALRPEVAASVSELFDLLADGTFKALPTQVFPVGELSSAFKFMSGGTHVGKIALTLANQSVFVEA
ncbi:MAG: zinc-binding dehydrogenase [Terracidiphilus sp.]|jgi:NADPH:quinone reductase-like Zn-dependent oxidoreductase